MPPATCMTKVLQPGLLASSVAVLTGPAPRLGVQTPKDPQLLHATARKTLLPLLRL